MRGPFEDNTPEVDAFCIESLRGIWSRLCLAASQSGTSIGAVADAAGISSSAVYRAIRSLQGTASNYIDSAFDQIMILCEQLEVDPDYILSGNGVMEKDINVDDLVLKMRKLSEEEKDQVRIRVLTKSLRHVNCDVG